MLAVRFYDPTTGQFLTRDPAVGMTRSAYGYAGNRPLNYTDPSGLYWGESYVNKAKDAAGSVLETVGHVDAEAQRAVIDVVAVGPYAAYYGSYYTLKGLNSLPGPVSAPVGATPVGPLPLRQTLEAAEAGGLGLDIAIDWVKGEDGADESCGQDDKRYINPLHSWLPEALRGPKVYLPGASRDANGDAHIDWEW